MYLPKITFWEEELNLQGFRQSPTLLFLDKTVEIKHHLIFLKQKQQVRGLSKGRWDLEQCPFTMIKTFGIVYCSYIWPRYQDQQHLVDCYSITKRRYFKQYF